MDIPSKLINLLNNKEIKEAINNNNFDYVYNEIYDKLNLSSLNVFTNILKEIEIDPIFYMTSIPAGFFLNNTDLKTYKIPNNIRVIKEYAFARCFNLNSLYIPKSINEIEDNAFYLCENLTHIYYEGTENEFAHIRKSLNSNRWFGFIIEYTDKIIEIFCSDGIITLGNN